MPTQIRRDALTPGEANVVKMWQEDQRHYMRQVEEDPDMPPNVHCIYQDEARYAHKKLARLMVLRGYWEREASIE